MLSSEIQDGRNGFQLKIYFSTSFPQPKGQLIRTLVGSIKEPCNSKIAKRFDLDGSHGGNIKNLFCPLLLNQKAN